MTLAPETVFGDRFEAKISGLRETFGSESPQFIPIGEAGSRPSAIDAFPPGNARAEAGPIVMPMPCGLPATSGPTDHPGAVSRPAATRGFIE